ncbi:hypothetical protein [Allosalinactinospora lopnorensis]|uniref:hypothetical protein n=1 Tax=Allosalinactinospora lopnorensis TaxID=1352348 RepID=UPI000623E279|nr:hypothetical protein [Allosalinactinospora lopnorensis]
MRARTYCEIRQVDTMDTLRAWATAMEVPVEQRGVTLEDHDVYTATHGVTTLVCVVPNRRHRRPPLNWESPFERM